MEIPEKINIYVNNNKLSTMTFKLETSLEELRNILEFTIPNDIVFMKEGNFLKSEEEKKLSIKDIIRDAKSIYLKQEYFQVFLDNKIIKKNANLFKKKALKTFIQIYQKELPKNIRIICEPNIIMEVDLGFIDENISINDILIGNCIYVYSEKKKIKNINIFENKKFGLLLKKNGNISFQSIKWENLEILDSLIFDCKYDKFLEEAVFEIRRKSSIEEYEKLKKDVLTKDLLEKFISNNKTNDKAIFDYLTILKKNNDPQFKEYLEKYAFLLDINRLRKLDDKFNNDIYKYYYDEKTNLINFLKRVIEGFYDEYEDINLIISELDFSDSIQKEIATPFIGNFDKDKYINCPIPISDNYLFFHYIRVKFFRFLQNAFQYQKVFKKFCKILLNKINKMTEENNSKSKSKLLIEILCMIIIYGFHSQKNELVLNYYSHEQEIDFDYYYHPIIFFKNIKIILLDYFYMIGNSNCLSTGIIEYKKIINYNSEKPAELNIKNSFDYLLRNTIFLPFFTNEEWGFTIPAFNLSFINIDIFDLQNDNSSYPDYIFLFYFIKYMITFLHEPLGHNLKIYESYNNNLQTPFDTPRIKDGKEEIVYEGGYLMEILLINSVKYLNIEHVLFLLDENNWQLDHVQFLQKFKEIGLPSLKNCLFSIEKSNMIKRLFNLFKITKNSIEKAIENKAVLNTQYDNRFNNEVGIIFFEEKFRTKKENIKEKEKENQKELKKRICRTHSFY